MTVMENSWTGRVKTYVSVESRKKGISYIQKTRWPSGLVVIACLNTAF